MRRLFAIVFVTLAGLAASPSQPAAGVQSVSRARAAARKAPKTPLVVRGVVTRYRPGRSLAIRDQSGSIFAYTEGTSPVAPGDVVEVTGIADVDSAGAPSIDKATYRKIGTDEPPRAIPVSAAELSRGRHDSELVSLDGTLERVEAARYEYGLVMRAGGVGFTAWVLREEGARAIMSRPGSRLRLTGAVSLTAPTNGATGFELLMRTGDDIVILDTPSWWTSRRIEASAIVLAGVVALLFSYVVLLRRQVGRQTAVIHERLRAETELKEQYRQAQKMEAVGRLAGGIAHDFNNIMTVVLGYSEMLELELEGNPDQMASIHEIKRAAERAAGLTRQMLAFSRGQKLERSIVDLNLVITEITSMFMRLLGGDIEVVAQPAAGPVTVMTDRAQLEQALLNLAVNARDAMPDGGRLTMTVSRAEDKAGQATGVLKVKDTGTGITTDARPHIFEPFFTTKDVGQGSGLGLSMVYGFVENSGGTIRFDTAPGGGTTFEIAFPLTTQEHRAADV
jgi:signal transduction histidine kinase